MRPSNVSRFLLGFAIVGMSCSGGKVASSSPAPLPSTTVAVETPAEPRDEIWIEIHDQGIKAPDHLPSGRAIFEISNATSDSWRVRVENGDRITPVDPTIPPQKSTTVEVYLLEGAMTIVCEAGTRRLEKKVTITKASR
jgi:hypothetical protein